MADTDSKRIKLVLEGMPRDEGHVRFDVFLNELGRLQSALSKLDADASDGKRNSYFAVVGLSHSSPATVELESRTVRGKADVTDAIFSNFQYVYDSVESGEISAEIDYGILEDLRKLAQPVGATLSAVSLQLNGATYPITSEIATKIEAHLAEYDECDGAVEGMLEKINVHDDANVFTIYPDAGAKNITCHFPNDLLDKAISGVKKKVSIFGLMRYRKIAPFPHHFDVSDLTIFPDENELATFEDLLGIAPDATGNMSSEDFVKEFRCGWQ